MHGNVFPIQVIVTKELAREENLWLHSLTDELPNRKEAEELLYIYKKHPKNMLYESVMEVIVKANYEKFKEVSGMCNALVEIMQPYIDEQIELRMNERIEQRVNEQVELRVNEQVALWVEEEERKMAECEREKGLEDGMELTRVLLMSGRMEDLNRAMDDKEYRKHLCKEFALL